MLRSLLSQGPPQYTAVSVCRADAQASGQAYLLSCKVGSHILQNLELLGVHAHGNLWHCDSHLRMSHHTQACTLAISLACYVHHHRTRRAEKELCFEVSGQMEVKTTYHKLSQTLHLGTTAASESPHPSQPCPDRHQGYEDPSTIHALNMRLVSDICTSSPPEPAAAPLVLPYM